MTPLKVCGSISGQVKSDAVSPPQLSCVTQGLIWGNRHHHSLQASAYHGEYYEDFNFLLKRRKRLRNYKLHGTTTNSFPKIAFWLKKYNKWNCKCEGASAEANNNTILELEEITKQQTISFNNIYIGTWCKSKQKCQLFEVWNDLSDRFPYSRNIVLFTLFFFIIVFCVLRWL